MMRFYKKALLFYLLSALGLLVAVVALSVVLLINGIDLLASRAYTLIFVFVVFMVVLWLALRANAIAQKEQLRQLSLLDEKCDPQAFLKAQEHSYRKALRVKRLCGRYGVVALVERQNHAVALDAAGETDEALREITELASAELNKKREYYRSLVSLNKAAFILKKGETGVADAREAIELARENIERNAEQIPVVLRQNYNSVATVVEYRTDVAQGINLDNAFDFFKKQLNVGVTLRQKLVCRRAVADIYERLGDAAARRAELEIIARDGGSLAIAREAAEQLAQLPAAE